MKKKNCKKGLFLLCLMIAVALFGCGEKQENYEADDERGNLTISESKESENSEEESEAEVDQVYDLEQLKEMIAQSDLKNCSQYGDVTHLAVKNGETYTYYNSNLRTILGYGREENNTQGLNGIVVLDNLMPVYSVSRNSGDEVVLFCENELPDCCYKVVDQPGRYVIPIALTMDWDGTYRTRAYYLWADTSTDNTADYLLASLTDGNRERVWGDRSHSSIELGLIDDMEPEQFMETCQETMGSLDTEGNGLLLVEDSPSSHVFSYYDGSTRYDYTAYCDFGIYDYSSYDLTYTITTRGYAQYDISGLEKGRYSLGGTLFEIID